MLEFEASLGYTEKLWVKNVNGKEMAYDLCTSCLTIAGTKKICHNQEQLTGEFVLAYSSRGRVYEGGGGMAAGRDGRKLGDPISDLNHT